MILYTIHGNGYQDISELASLEDVTVYVNLTNRCPCACTFCLRQTKEMEEGHSLWLKEEPTVEDVIKEFQKYDLDDFHEVVFCGFGEPLERVEDVIQIAGILKHFRRDLPIRVNTNGLACLIHQRDVTPEFKGRIDTVSISLNSSTAQKYLDVTRNRFGLASYDAMLSFAKACQRYVPNVVMTVVDVIGAEEVAACQKVCDTHGLQLRVRPYEAN